MNALPASIDVAVIGAGPVGLTASLLLSRFGVSHLVVEQRRAPTDHPRAHFISCRSMEIFRELGGVDRAIREAAAPLDEWRRYVYCTDLVRLPGSLADRPAPDALLGVTDHFPQGPDPAASPIWECNLPQHVLVRLLREAAVGNRHCRLLEGWRAEVDEACGYIRVTPPDGEADQRLEIKCSYIVCADGARSANRELLGIRRRKKTPVLQHLINVHFFSPELADLLRRRIMAMLYFVYTPHAIGVFVNHSLERGEFVLQLPFFPDHQDADGFTGAVCADIITRLVGRPVGADIRDIRPWRLSAWVAERFQSDSGRCFLAGDAAHQVLPAGGFGMNCGIADVHNLAWKLARALKNTDRNRAANVRDLLETYDAERRPVAERYLELSKQNFDRSLAVPGAIGLDWQAARWLDRFVRILPTPHFVRRRVFDLGLRVGLAQVKLMNSDNWVSAIRRKDLHKIFSDPARILQMRFPRQDLGVVYPNGWLEGLVETDFYRSEGVEYTPAWILGARLPHFCIHAPRGDDSLRISSLDLPAIGAGKVDGPVYVLLVFDSDADAVRKDAARLSRRYSPLVRFAIGRSHAPSRNVDYVFADDPPTVQPLPRAVLVRPDGHVAWMATGDST
jgi:2-polyprenyl-6-methoxyphenol hydroxylase-like FAD-dependent oxidoreductase